MLTEAKAVFMTPHEYMRKSKDVRKQFKAKRPNAQAVAYCPPIINPSKGLLMRKNPAQEAPLQK